MGSLHRLRPLRGHLSDRGDAAASMGPADCEPIDVHLIPRWDRGPAVPGLEALGSRLRQQTGREGQDSSKCWTWLAGRPTEATDKEDPALGRDQRPGASSSCGRDDHRLDEGVRESNPALYQEAKLELFAERVGRGRGSAFPEGRRASCRHGRPRTSAPRLRRPRSLWPTIAVGRARPRPRKQLERRHQHRRAGVPSLDRARWGCRQAPCRYGTILLGYPAETYLPDPGAKPP